MRRTMSPFLGDRSKNLLFLEFNFEYVIFVQSTDGRLRCKGAFRRGGGGERSSTSPLISSATEFYFPPLFSFNKFHPSLNFFSQSSL